VAALRSFLHRFSKNKGREGEEAERENGWTYEGKEVEMCMCMKEKERERDRKSDAEKRAA
jgi:hypothetical protein